MGKHMQPTSRDAPDVFRVFFAFQRYFVQDFARNGIK